MIHNIRHLQLSLSKGWKSFLFLGLIMSMLIVGCGRSDSTGSSSYPPPQIATPEANASYPAPTAATVVTVIHEVLIPSPVLGVVVDKNMKIVYVEPDSAAEQAGLQAGDVLETLENVPISSNVAKVKDIIHSATANQKLHLTFTRSSQKITIEITLTPPNEIILTPPNPRPSPEQPLATSTPVLPPQDYL